LNELRICAKAISAFRTSMEKINPYIDNVSSFTPRQRAAIPPRLRRWFGKGGESLAQCEAAFSSLCLMTIDQQAKRGYIHKGLSDEDRQWLIEPVLPMTPLRRPLGDTTAVGIEGVENLLTLLDEHRRYVSSNSYNRLGAIFGIAKIDKEDPKLDDAKFALQQLIPIASLLKVERFSYRVGTEVLDRLAMADANAWLRATRDQLVQPKDLGWKVIRQIANNANTDERHYLQTPPAQKWNHAVRAAIGGYVSGIEGVMVDPDLEEWGYRGATVGELPVYPRTDSFFDPERESARLVIFDSLRDPMMSQDQIRMFDSTVDALKGIATSIVAERVATHEMPDGERKSRRAAELDFMSAQWIALVGGMVHAFGGDRSTVSPWLIAAPDDVEQRAIAYSRLSSSAPGDHVVFGPEIESVVNACKTVGVESVEDLLKPIKDFRNALGRHSKALNIALAVRMEQAWKGAYVPDDLLLFRGKFNPLLPIEATITRTRGRLSRQGAESLFQDMLNSPLVAPMDRMWLDLVSAHQHVADLSRQRGCELVHRSLIRQGVVPEDTHWTFSKKFIENMPTWQGAAPKEREQLVVGALRRTATDTQIPVNFVSMTEFATWRPLRRSIAWFDEEIGEAARQLPQVQRAVDAVKEAEFARRALDLRDLPSEERDALKRRAEDLIVDATACLFGGPLRGSEEGKRRYKALSKDAIGRSALAGDLAVPDEIAKLPTKCASISESLERAKHVPHADTPELAAGHEALRAAAEARHAIFVQNVSARLSVSTPDAEKFVAMPPDVTTSLLDTYGGSKDRVRLQSAIQHWSPPEDPPTPEGGQPAAPKGPKRDPSSPTTAVATPDKPSPLPRTTGDTPTRPHSDRPLPSPVEPPEGPPDAGETRQTALPESASSTPLPSPKPPASKPTSPMPTSPMPIAPPSTPRRMTTPSPDSPQSGRSRRRILPAVPYVPPEATREQTATPQHEQPQTPQGDPRLPAPPSQLPRSALPLPPATEEPSGPEPPGMGRELPGAP
jgi:hypothetical protein